MELKSTDIRIILLLFFFLTILGCGGGDRDAAGGVVNPPSPTPTPTPSPTVVVPSEEEQSITKPMSSEGGKTDITFTASENWTVSVIITRSNNDWISVYPTSGSKGEATITVSLLQNDTYDERSANIEIKAGTYTKTLSITQKQLDALIITSNNQTIAADGGTLRIEVKSNVSYTCTIDKNVTWIHGGQTRGLKTSEIALLIDKNEIGSARIGQVVIASGELKEVVTITQEPGNATQEPEQTPETTPDQPSQPNDEPTSQPTPEPVPSHSTIQFLITQFSLIPGDAKTLEVKDAIGQVKWSGSDTKVATVSSSGMVTAVASGEATIVATDGAGSASCKVVVLRNTDAEHIISDWDSGGSDTGIINPESGE